ncbi:expressed protein, partial [Phakopsora pachyrhizi]
FFFTLCSLTTIVLAGIGDDMVKTVPKVFPINTVPDQPPKIETKVSTFRPSSESFYEGADWTTSEEDHLVSLRTYKINDVQSKSHELHFSQSDSSANFHKQYEDNEGLFNRWNKFSAFESSADFQHNLIESVYSFYGHTENSVNSWNNDLMDWDETLFDFDPLELAETSETSNTLKPVQSGITGSQIRDDSLHLIHGTHPPNVPSPILNTRGDIHQIYRDVIDLDHSVKNSPRQNSNDVQPALREVTSPSARPKSTQESSGSQLSFIKSEPVNFSKKQFNYPKIPAEAEFDFPGWETIQQTYDETEQHLPEGSLKSSKFFGKIDRHQSNPELYELSEAQQQEGPNTKIMGYTQNVEIKKKAKLAEAIIKLKQKKINERKATQMDSSPDDISSSVLQQTIKEINPPKRQKNLEENKMTLVNELLDAKKYQNSILFDLLNPNASQLGTEFFKNIAEIVNYISNIAMKTAVFSFFKNLELYMSNRRYNKLIICAKDLGKFGIYRPVDEIEVQAVRIYGYTKEKQVCSNKRFIEKTDELKLLEGYKKLFLIDSMIKSREKLWNVINVDLPDCKANKSNLQKSLNYKKRFIIDLREKFFTIVVVVSKVLRDITKDNEDIDVRIKQKEALEIFDETLMEVDVRRTKSTLGIAKTSNEITFSTEVLANRLTIHFARSYYKPIAQGKYIRSIFFIWLKRSYPSFGVLLVNANEAYKFWAFFKDLTYCIMELEHGNWLTAEKQRVL